MRATSLKASHKVNKTKRESEWMTMTNKYKVGIKSSIMWYDVQ